MPNSNPKTWYLVQCKPRESARAQEHLSGQHFECFLPTHQVKRTRRGRTYWVTEPLFPHYLFIHLSHLSNWSIIRSTRGVNKVVEFNGKPAVVADAIVKAIRHHCAIAAGAEPEPLYKAGESVIITEGCFRELEAIVKTAKTDERIILLLNILNRQQEIELPANAIKPSDQ